MKNLTRRDFLRKGSFGLAAFGVGALALRVGADPTEASGDIGSYGDYLSRPPKPPANVKDKFAPTEDNILGPFHRGGAPFRAKITPPLEAGTVRLVSGRVWAHDTKKPLASAAIDIWQADSKGRYDNDDPKNPPAKNVFKNRARLITDEAGYYEYETVHPGRYKIGENVWRPSHIHYLVRHQGYRTLVTQLYFKGDPMNKDDAFIKESLIIELKEQKVGDAAYEVGTFDIVLAKA